MDNPYVGVIFTHSGTFAPYGWAFCQGQLLSIADNSTLYSLLGTTFGGDGVQTFGLPDLRGRIPVGQGQGPGLSNYVLGQMSGTENVTILSAQMPTHNHNVNVVNAAGNVAVPVAGNNLAGTYAGSNAVNFYATGTPNATLAPTTIGTAGSSIPVSIMQPILAMSYIISLFGIYPSRN